MPSNRLLSASKYSIGTPEKKTKEMFPWFLRSTRNIVEIIEREAVPMIRIGIIHMVLFVSAENLGAFGACGVQPINLFMAEPRWCHLAETRVAVSHMYRTLGDE